MALRQARLDDLVDLRLRVRLHPRFHSPVVAAPLHNDPQRAGLLRVRQRLLELARRRLVHVPAVDGDDAVAFLQVGVRRRTVRNDRLDHQAGLELHDGDAEIAPSGQHAPDGLLAFARRRVALLRLVGGVERGGGKKEYGSEFDDAGVHAETGFLFGRRLLYAWTLATLITNQKMSNEFHVP